MTYPQNHTLICLPGKLPVFRKVLGGWQKLAIRGKKMAVFLTSIHAGRSVHEQPDCAAKESNHTDRNRAPNALWLDRKPDVCEALCIRKTIDHGKTTPKK